LCFWETVYATEIFFFTEMSYFEPLGRQGVRLEAKIHELSVSVTSLTIKLRASFCYIIQSAWAITSWSVEWRLPEPSERKIWSWVSWVSEQRITVLARASSNLAVSQLTDYTLILAERRLRLR
jgi:hypothetical protein